ncbi:hypothetical protein Rvan_2834 [Rhodomicrobium vannielii ATCC 17100]|uniref:Uncharacterized protein n=1 Tax=Rhodomicrobium vannielii (strain ATCC 17100 / DSM 162 / LMG 4299 / NCIMB 10020 / ATH 3.1.1) TaxID=648757 RepID=E3I8R3_RHOVT|nr:hypothetical protein Rvan_2834 [Rhodomicrobium vannielii ATCC 17100]
MARKRRFLVPFAKLIHREGSFLVRIPTDIHGGFHGEVFERCRRGDR